MGRFFKNLMAVASFIVSVYGATAIPDINIDAIPTVQAELETFREHLNFQI
ncbi:MAG: hypothetical protein I8H80_02300 [Alphaproteobacteria bacterium]|jgi:hypothetical protein|nr:hypothetical protein [Alphaproteobacteria bacterium]